MTDHGPAHQRKEKQTEKSVKAEPTDEKPQDAEQRELVAQLQRLQAEFENYKKRVEREAEEFKSWAVADVLKDLLGVVDNLELALRNATAQEKDGFYRGVELVYAQVEELLTKRGVQQIKAAGQFDPRLHEAMLSEEGKEPKNKIIEVLQRGYLLDGKILRTAKVKVAR